MDEQYIREIIAIARRKDLEEQTKICFISDLMHEYEYKPGYEAGYKEGHKVGSGHYNKAKPYDDNPRALKANTFKPGLN